MLEAMLFPEIGIKIDEEDLKKVQWYSIWAVGTPKKGNHHNWFNVHAIEDKDFLSLSYVLHTYYEIKELEKLNCSPFDLNSHALKRLSLKEGYEDVKECLKYLNSVHLIVLNQKVAHSSSDDEYWIVHSKALQEQLKYIRKFAYSKGYDVTLGALAATLPFARDRGECVSKLEGDGKDILYHPTEEDIKVAKQFWQRANDDLPYNALDKFYAKKFPNKFVPEIENIFNYLTL